MKWLTSSLMISAVFFSVAATAEPIAPLAPLNDFGKQAFAAEGKTEAEMEKDIPPKDLVGLPPYPGSYFGSSMGDGDELNSVILISSDSTEQVVAWYQRELGSEWQYLPELATQQMNEVGVFVNTSDQAISAMDALRHRQIRISKVEKPEDTGFVAMMFDVKGIKSMIVMTIRPFM